MSRIIARKNPVIFKTQAIHVKASPEVLCYTPVGNPLGFADMQDLRQPVTVKDPESFELTVANMGVSVDLSLTWQGRDFRVLIRQDRVEQDDNVLKLISGYVPAHELRVPLLTVMTEIAEELLLESNRGWLQGRYMETWLPTPYSSSLKLSKRHSYQLTPHRGAEHPVLCRELHLIERPRAYVHLPTNSLQLVYSMQLELPENSPGLTMLHADEHMDTEKDQLLVEMNYQRPEIFLAEMSEGVATGKLFSLEQGELVPRRPKNIWLSEALAPQTGWVIEDPRSQWPEGLARL